MNLIVVFCGLFSLTVAVEHATDIQIDQVEVIEIPWQEAPPQQGGNPPPPAYGPPPPVYGPPPPDCSPSSEFEPPVEEPKPVYGPPPKPVYGPPPEEPTTTEMPTTTELGTTTESSTDESTTTELPTTTGAPGNETSNKSEQLRVKKDDTEQLRGKKDDTNQGVYYIYHPEGMLQRVSYLTKGDDKNMEYTAKLKYHNVEPIKGPIYTYDPKTFAFQRLNK